MKSEIGARLMMREEEKKRSKVGITGLLYTNSRFDCAFLQCCESVPSFNAAI